MFQLQLLQDVAEKSYDQLMQTVLKGTAPGDPKAPPLKVDLSIEKL